MSKNLSLSSRSSSAHHCRRGVVNYIILLGIAAVVVAAAATALQQGRIIVSISIVKEISAVILSAITTSTTAAAPSCRDDDSDDDHQGCQSELDCSLNGVCNNGSNNNGSVCICDKPWKGPNCELLDVLPVKFPQGYGMTPNTTTWGGGIIHHGSGDTYHLFVSRMANDCLLEDWITNSRIDHAISHTGPEGPYQFSDVALDTWAHNPAPLTLKDGRYVLFHIGNAATGPNGGKNCTNSSSSTTSIASSSRKMAQTQMQLDFDIDNNIHISPSLWGPWKPLKTNLGSCNNPAPWIHPNNGTIYVGCRGALKRADKIDGPYVDIGKFPEGLIENSGIVQGHYEDPQLYTDNRGNFHILYHVYTTDLPSFNCENSTVSAHAYSQDGYKWYISSKQPYTTQLEISVDDDYDDHDSEKNKDDDDDDGKSTTSKTQFITLATRERPKPFFNQHGVMTHLVQGVCGSPYW